MLAVHLFVGSPASLRWLTSRDSPAANAVQAFQKFQKVSQEKPLFTSYFTHVRTTASICAPSTSWQGNGATIFRVLGSLHVQDSAAYSILCICHGQFREPNLEYRQSKYRAGTQEKMCGLVLRFPSSCCGYTQPGPTAHGAVAHRTLCFSSPACFPPSATATPWNSFDDKQKLINQYLHQKTTHPPTST